MFVKLPLWLYLVSVCYFSFPYLSLASQDAYLNRTITNEADEITQGLISYQINSQHKQMFALDTQVEMTVSGLVNRVTVKQIFNNVEDSWIHAKYIFPLPENSAVDGMNLLIGDRVIEGVIKPKQQAKQQFEQAKQQGKQASLVSQQRTNVFTTQLANIGPLQQVTVEITYLQTISYQDGLFSLRFPLVVVPRYRPDFQRSTFSETKELISPMLDPLNVQRNTEGQNASASHKVSIHIDIDGGFDITKLSSPFHDIQQHQNGRKTNVSLQGKVPLDRDFVLQWQTSVGDEVAATVFFQTGKTYQDKANADVNLDQPKDIYAMAMLFPPTLTSKAQQQISRELILVIDTSGSMAGESIIQAKQALNIALTALKPNDSFNIIEFNSSVSALFSDAKPANSVYLQEAKRFIGSLNADGGTEMAPALDRALTSSINANAKAGSLRQVIFMTDGAVSNEAQLFEQISYQLQDSRLFTVGIGSAPNSHFMTRAARVGRGTFTYIGKSEEVEQKISQLLTKISQPILTDVELYNLDGSVPDYWPAQIDDVYQSDPATVSFKMPADQLQPVIISGHINGQYWQQQLDFNQGRAAVGIDLLWANTQITALELSQSHANRQKVAKQVEALAMLYHLVSSQTSLLAVDVTPVNPHHPDKSEHQLATLLPAGWQASASQQGVLPQTATASRLWLLIGMSLLALTLLYGLWLKGLLPAQRLILNSAE
ncbi:marine proteobacterial sortase target protein [Shewanella glacialimarina]|uniref:marine proteobacterial sortase target protein n=1 Tax=Shewanella glacialimarina TaxID=2590884 RepID=UPI001CF8F54B|nr:marine proteobacterial sortase target protein [Shewanella glacialimarina]UCX05064.1 marine proteobacterial sortase target protein [Shewanella glacialimarina]